MKKTLKSKNSLSNYPFLFFQLYQIIKPLKKPTSKLNYVKKRITNHYIENWSLKYPKL